MDLMLYPLMVEVYMGCYMRSRPPLGGEWPTNNLKSHASRPDNWTSLTMRRKCGIAVEGWPKQRHRMLGSILFTFQYTHFIYCQSHCEISPYIHNCVLYITKSKRPLYRLLRESPWFILMMITRRFMLLKFNLSLIHMHTYTKFSLHKINS